MIWLLPRGRAAWLPPVGFLLTAALSVLVVQPAQSADNAAASAEKSSERIIIYSSLPRTGNAKLQTDSIVNGIQMALDDVDRRVGPYSLEYQDHDDATASAGNWTAEQESANAHEAVNNSDAMVYIGPYNSGAAKNSMPILNNAGVLMISPANTAVGLTKHNAADLSEPDVYRPSGKLNYVRVVPTDDLQGPLGADWAKALGVRRVFVLDDREVYGRGIATEFKNRCDEIGIEVVGEDSVDAKSLEFRPLMTAVKGKNPDLVYFGGTTQSKAGQIAKDMTAVGLNAKLMVPDGCMESAFIESAGADVLNGRCYVTFGGLPSEAFVPPDQKDYKSKDEYKAEQKKYEERVETHKAQKEFVDRYQKRFGRLPEAYAIYGYESARVAIRAIREAGKKDRAAVTSAALAIRDFPGAMGHWSFDANGDTTMHKMSGNIVRDGKFVFDRILGD
jgi:branched-chain amino acid transport system substrate-binding protein